MESKFQALGQYLAPLYKQMAPLSYGAQVSHSTSSSELSSFYQSVEWYLPASTYDYPAVVVA